MHSAYGGRMQRNMAQLQAQARHACLPGMAPSSQARPSPHLPTETRLQEPALWWLGTTLEPAVGKSGRQQSGCELSNGCRACGHALAQQAGAATAGQATAQAAHSPSSEAPSAPAHHHGRPRLPLAARRSPALLLLLLLLLRRRRRLLLLLLQLPRQFPLLRWLGVLLLLLRCRPM